MWTQSPNNKWSARRLTRLALLTAIALSVFIVESYIPNPLTAALPGAKLGLANVVTVYAMFALGPADTLLVLLARIVLGSIFSGNMMALAYSLFGGIACYLAMLILRRLGTGQIWLCSCLCGAAHNAAQLLSAMIITSTAQVVYYLPFLLLAGLAAGLFTGVCAQLLVTRLKLLP